jgi:glycosyltransferase involved in cell wall biosynthesis
LERGFPLKIAQVAPLYESVPPRLYGGTERVVSYLTEELVEMGHEVTLFASGDSTTRAELVAVSPRALRLSRECVDPHIYHTLLLEQVFQRREAFDVIHFHIDYMHFPMSRRVELNQLTTLHGRLDLPDLVPLYREYAEMPLTSISNAQRKPLSWANWVANIYHGLPKNLFTPQAAHGKYLAFVGRISPEKRVDRAIQIALRAGIPLKIAAKVDTPDREYFAQVIEPMLGEPSVEFLGEISEPQKNELLGQAYALMFPIGWPEPFGLAMIEAMACGTPVIAYPCGSVPEVVDEGKTGFIVSSEEEALKALERIESLNRMACRRVFEERFSADRMAREYTAVYSCLCERESTTRMTLDGGTVWTKSSESRKNFTSSLPQL